MMFSASQSKVKLWRRCRYAYTLKYIEKLKKKIVKRPFQFGKIIHRMIEEDANGHDPFELLEEIAIDKAKLFAREKELYGDIVEDIEFIMDAYFDYWDDDSIEYLSKGGQNAEFKFNVEIAPGIMANGIVDAFVQTPNELVWCGDHKTFKKRPNDDDRWRNVQSSIYMRCIELLGWGPVDGFFWNYIHSKTPTRPYLLKNETLSKKHIVSLPGVVRATIREHKLKTKDYKQFIDSQKENYKHYFKRVYMPVSDQVVDSVVKDFINTCHEIDQLHGKDQTRSIDFNCGMCDFQDICRAGLTGGDEDFIKRKYYEKSQKFQETNIIHEYTKKGGIKKIKPPKQKNNKGKAGLKN